MNSNKSLSRLLEQRKLKKQTVGIDQLNALLYAANRNIQAAKANIDKFEETAYKSAYDALLQIARVVVMSENLTPADGEQHKTTFTVAGLLLGTNFDQLIRKIQRLRIKRNTCVYDPVSFISKQEANDIIKTCIVFWNKAKTYLLDKHPQLELFPVVKYL